MGDDPVSSELPPVIDLVGEKIRVVHIVKSEEDQTALCTGKPYSLPRYSSGEKIKLCDECWHIVIKGSPILEAPKSVS